MSTSIDIRALRILLAVAERGNMTDASKLLGITQSAVSQVIHQIEKEVGMVLFDRNHRPLRLTASGVVLARRAQDIISRTEQLVAATREADVLPELRVGLIDSFAGTVGPHIVRMLRTRAKNIKLWTGLTSRLSQDLLERTIDIAVCAEEILDYDDIRQIVLFREPFILALPRSLKPVNRALDTLAAALPLIRYSARSHTGMQIDRHLRRVGLRIDRGLEMDSSESVFAMVAEGVGWAISTPLCVAHARPDRERIVFVPLSGVGFTREIVLVHRVGEYDDLADLISELSWAGLRNHVLPAVRQFSAPAAEQMVVCRRPAGEAATDTQPG